MGKKIVSFLMIILLMIVVWLGLIGALYLAGGIVPMMGVVICGILLIPAIIRVIYLKKLKKHVDEKLSM